MLSSLRSTRRLAASLTVCCIVFSYSGSTALAQVTTGALPLANPPQIEQPEVVTLEGTLIASHGGEGTSGAGVVPGATAAPVLATVQGQVSKAALSNSLWGNLLLSMAFQRDPEIQKLARKMGRVNTLTLLSIAGVTGLGLAQSIYAFNQIEPQSIDVTEAHHPGGHDHVHIPADSRVPSTLGIVGSGVTLATLGVNAVMNKRYSSKLAARQLSIKQKVDHIITHLKSGEEPDHTRQELTVLVGNEATDEFLSLWQATHPNSR